jgi:hypothetical protein
MARVGAVVAASLLTGFVLTGCGSTGSGGGGTGSLFSSSPLDVFKTSSKATTGGTSGTGPLVDTDYDCPEVKVRSGAATLTIGGKPGEAEPNPLEVRYQGSITRTARECHLSGNIMTMKVGIEGRIITGPAGGPGNVDVPLRIAVVQKGPTPKTVASKFGRESVTLTGELDRANFTHIDADVSFPLPNPVSNIVAYIVYVGFDPLGAQPQVKHKPAPKQKPRPAAKPRSS